MAGILDPKQRVIDFILTTKGREQIANNDLDISFVSFTDRGIFYDESSTEGVAASIANQITFEAYTSDFADNIVPETNDLGNLRYTLNTTGSFGVNNKLYTKATGSEGIYFLNTGSLPIYEAIGNILSQSVEKYSNLRTLGTIGSITSRENFAVSLNTVTFNDFENAGNIETLNPVLFDHRLSNLPQYEYLPPVVDLGDQKRPMAAYQKFLFDSNDDYDSYYENLVAGKQKAEFTFKTKNLEQTVLGQIFFNGNQGIEKLIAIDLGNLFNEFKQPVARVFHMGNLYTDSSGVLKFVRHFSLLFKY